VSGSAETFNTLVSISIIWSLTGTMSLESGVTVNSITVEAAPLIFDIEEIFKEFSVI